MKIIKVTKEYYETEEAKKWKFIIYCVWVIENYLKKAKKTGIRFLKKWIKKRPTRKEVIKISEEELDFQFISGGNAMFLKLDLIPDKGKMKRVNKSNEILVNITQIATIYPSPNIKNKTEICFVGGLDEPYIVLNHSFDELKKLLDDFVVNE